MENKSVRDLFLERERETLSVYACMTSDSRGREDRKSVV